MLHVVGAITLVLTNVRSSFDTIAGEAASASARFGLQDGRFCFGVITHADPAMSLRACTSVPTEFSLVSFISFTPYQSYHVQ